MSDVPREPRVLVIDDSALVRRILALTCRQIPELVYSDIDQAADGYEALKMLREHDYELILADIRMPRLDGYEMVRRIRQDLGDTKTPIILISTLGSEEDVRRGIEAGATAYVIKPLSPYRVKLVIQKLLHSKKVSKRTP
ncbi:MAG: response regulator [Vicinamibacteria bacterium]|nr:response regulator [Vicinamibacteria bacterium]